MSVTYESVVLAMLVGLVCVGCNAGECSCAPKGVVITSSTSDLVGASGCGHATSCSVTSPCDFLSVEPPADGGSCTVGILFADGGTQVVTADFGAVHHSTDCCGDFFDQSLVTVKVE